MIKIKNKYTLINIGEIIIIIIEKTLENIPIIIRIRILEVIIYKDKNNINK